MSQKRAADAEPAADQSRRPDFSVRHVEEMTLAELEQFERENGIARPWHVIERRRRDREQIDARAMRNRAMREGG